MRIVSVGLCAAVVGLIACGPQEAPTEDAGRDAGGAGGGIAGEDGGEGGEGGGNAGEGGGSAGEGGEGGGSAGEGGGSGGTGGGQGGGDVPDGGETDGGTADGGRQDAGTWRAPFDWVGIVGNGQSLSVGSVSGPVVTTAASFNNKILVESGGNYPLDGGGNWSLAPLREPIRSIINVQADYPDNIRGETPHSSLGNQLTAMAKAAGAADYISVHSVVGRGGRCLYEINKRGRNGIVRPPYPASIAEARVFKRLAMTANKTFGYGAVVLTHGECDATNSAYLSGLVQLQADYQADLAQITGQTRVIPLIGSQQSAQSVNVATNSPVVHSAVTLWRAGVENPGKIICSGPKYQYRYASDRLHMVANSYRAMGAKYAQIIDAVVNKNETWQPLQPTSARRQGRVVTVTFHVPRGPLAWEESLERPHQSGRWAAWREGRGFELIDSSGALTIASSAISGNNVVLTLQAAPSGTNLRVRYALAQDGTGFFGGSVEGMRGQLRDSDPTQGVDAQALSCTVNAGSPSVTCIGDVSTRNVRDRVTGTGLPADGAVVTAMSGSTFTLSSPWSGTAGTRMLRFAYDLRNYSVHFDMPVQVAP